MPITALVFPRVHSRNPTAARERHTFLWPRLLSFESHVHLEAVDIGQGDRQKVLNNGRS